MLVVFCNNGLYYSCYGYDQVAKEEALGMDKNRRKLSLQEEYWVRRDDEMVVHHVTRLTIYITFVAFTIQNRGGMGASSY